MFRLFPSEGDEKKMRRIVHDPVGRAPRHVSVEFFARKIEDLTCLWVNII